MNIEKQICSPSEISKVIGISESRFYVLVRRNVFEKLDKGKYNLVKCVQSYLQFKNSGLSSSTEDGKDDLEKEKLLLTAAKREKEQIQLAIIKGEVHLSEDVETILNDMVASFRAKLLSIPSKVAPKIENRTAQQIKLELDKEIDETLEELSLYDPQQFYDINKKYVDLNTDDE